MVFLEGAVEAVDERETTTGKAYKTIRVAGKVIFVWVPSKLAGIVAGMRVRVEFTDDYYPKLTRIVPLPSAGTLTPESNPAGLSGHFMDVRGDIADLQTLLVSGVIPSLKRIEDHLGTFPVLKSKLTRALEAAAEENKAAVK